MATESEIIARLGAVIDPQPEPAPAEQTEQTAESAQEQGAPPEALLAPTPPAEPEEEGTPIETLNDLAEAMGVDVAELYNVRLPVDIEGQGKKEITLGQWKDLYRDSEVLEAKRADIERQRAEVEVLHKSKVEAFEAKEREAADMLNYMEQQLFSRYSGVDWNSLRQSDPGQWAAISFQFEQEKNQLAQIRSSAALKWDNAKRELAQAEEARNREVTTQEFRQLMEAVPEWKDPVKYEADASKIAHFLLQSGYSQQEVQGIRLKQVLLARDAMRYREMTATNAATKKVFRLGKKVLQPGARSSPAEQDSSKVAALSARLKKTGNPKDAAALISERLRR